MPSLDPGDIYRDLVLAYEMQRGRPVGQALTDLQIAAQDIAAARRAAQAAAPVARAAVPIIAGGAGALYALEAAAVGAAFTAAAPYIAGAAGAYAGALIIGGAFETFQVLGQTRAAEAQAKQLEFEARTLAPRLQAARLAAEGAAQRAADAERRFQSVQASIEERELARREAIAARDAQLAEQRAVERYESQQFQIEQQQRRFEEQRELQAERQQAAREAEDRRAEAQKERDATIAAAREEAQNREFEFRAAVEFGRAVQQAQRLELERERIELQRARDAAVEKARADALARQQATLLPLGSSPIRELALSDRPGGYRPSNCIDWQSAVASGLVAGIYWDPYVGTRVTSPMGSTYSSNVTGCAWGYIGDPRRRIVLGERVPELL